MATVNFQHTLRASGGRFELDLFALSGLDCIIKIIVDAINLPEGETVQVDGQAFWVAAYQQFLLTHDIPSHTIEPTPQMDNCCWSKSAHGNKFKGTAPAVAWGVTLDFEVIGTTFDCTGDSSSSSGAWTPCDPLTSSSSGS